MFAHALAILGIAILGIEVYRTTQRFGSTRLGMVGMIVAAAKAHMLLAAIFILIGVWLFTVEAVPIYTGPAIILIGLWYLLAALKQRQREVRAKREKQAQDLEDKPGE